jgi:hypothetical protein
MIGFKSSKYDSGGGGWGWLALGEKDGVVGEYCVVCEEVIQARCVVWCLGMGLVVCDVYITALSF